MSDKEQDIVTHETTIRDVNNATLADATLQQKPSLLTKRMFKVAFLELENASFPVILTRCSCTGLSQ